MTPWWLRPTAEGASKEEKPEESPSPAAAIPAEDEAVAAPVTAPAAETAAMPEIPWRPWRPELELESAATFEAKPREDVEDRIAPLSPEQSPETTDGMSRELAGELVDESSEEVVDESATGTSAEPESEESRERRRRSRRRGGRRRGGRGNAAEGAGGEEAEEDDDLDEAAEAPVAAAPAPVPAPTPPPTPIARRAAPAVDEAARRREAFAVAPEIEPPVGIIREVVYTSERRGGDEKKIALFCDLENIALGVRDSDIKKFDIELVLERLLEKGKIIVKKAYADWERYSDYKRPFHEAAIELIDIPQKYYSGKNSADIKMVVDAMDLSYSKEHLDTFVLLSGDSDFSPLVSKLKENNKYVIGIGVKNSSSALLIDNCDEFIFYEDVWRDQQKAPQVVAANKKSSEAFSLMVESIQALLRENKDVLWGSMIKQTMQRKKPSFNEGYYGYSTFSELLEDAERSNLIKLKKDQRSGTYIVTGFASGRK